MSKIIVCLDSRLIKPGEYFVPVKGDNFDGHKYIDDVIKKGAVGIIEVEELYQIAKEKLSKIKPVIVGVAGSVGKSSMRAYLTQILSTKYSVLEGDLNTKLGLSTLIVNKLEKQKIIVAELGIDRLGEMKTVTDFIEPDFSIITKLEKEHLVFLLSLDNVINENLVSIKNSKSKQGYINISDRELIEDKIAKVQIIYYPTDDINQKIIEGISSIELPKHDRDYLMGIYQICRDKFDFTDSEYTKALEKIKRSKGRLNLINGINKSLILDDSYNAVADQSIIQGIKFAEEMSKKYHKKLVIVLSPMRETGETETEQHKNVAEYLNSLANVDIIVVGDESRLYTKFLTQKYKTISSSEEFTYDINGDELFYVKGSQFYRLEKIVYYLMKDKQTAEQILVRQDARWKY